MKTKHVLAALAVVVLVLVGVTLWTGGEHGVSNALTPDAPVLRIDVGKPGAQVGNVAGEAGGRALVPAPVAVPAPTSARLTVHVTWRDDGAAVEGVAVLCRLAQETGAFAITDARGEARFEGKKAESQHAAPLLELATVILGCNNAHLVQEDGSWKVIGDPTAEVSRATFRLRPQTQHGDS